VILQGTVHDTAFATERLAVEPKTRPSDVQFNIAVEFVGEGAFAFRDLSRGTQDSRIGSNLISVIDGL
jgi:hypothetical protein